jgi:predicted RNA binding protein YcfA (HicA-like mRNA interferase family)
MTEWPACKARTLFATLLRIGWAQKRQAGSHRTLSREGWPDFVFAFHEGEEIGPRMLARIAKHTGLSNFRLGAAELPSRIVPQDFLGLSY